MAKPTFQELQSLHNAAVTAARTYERATPSTASARRLQDVWHAAEDKFTAALLMAQDHA